QPGRTGCRGPGQPVGACRFVFAGNTVITGLAGTVIILFPAIRQYITGISISSGTGKCKWCGDGNSIVLYRCYNWSSVDTRKRSGDRAGLASKVILDLLDSSPVEHTNRVRSHVLAGDTGITHDGDTGTHFLIYS